MTDDDSSDSWDGVLENLHRRRVAARAMGGEERLAKHRAAGKLDARARVEHLLDTGSFLELGTLVGGEEAPADAIVMGSGRIDGPPVVYESLGEQISKEELGGPAVALASGLIHNVADDDQAALDLVRLYLRYFPSSAWSYPPDIEGGDIGPRPVPELLAIVPRNGPR